MTPVHPRPRLGLATVVREWGRIGCIGFGGPPAHIALLRERCVTRHGWIEPDEFEDAIAACNLLPGPASTQLAIYCAWHVAGPVGAVVGGLAFIVPGLLAILALSAVFLASAPPSWVLAAGAGAGAAVASVAVHAGWNFVPASWKRAASGLRWIAYFVLGGVAAATVGPWLVMVLLACGGVEVISRRVTEGGRVPMHIGPTAFITTAATAGGLWALSWTALKVGALSYGGGFVIIPLIQHDAVERYHWMTATQFLDAVALGQVTPGPVVLTVAVVGFAAAGVGGALLAAAVAFTPSFGFVLIGAPHFGALRRNTTARAFLEGAGPAAIGAIIGVAVPLSRALHEGWQFAVLGGAAVCLFVLRRGVVFTLVVAAAVGVAAVQWGAPLP